MKKILLISLLITTLLTACGAVGLFYPPMKIYMEETDGKAELAKAEYSKKVQIADAEGKKQAATLLADAEVERAKGVAEANKIIGKSLQGNESYLRYLYIHGLETAEKNGSQIIYIPTEAGLPILESQRLNLYKGK